MIPARQPQHCGHECVCPEYKASHSDWEEDPDPCTFSCMQRATHTSAPAPAAWQYKEMKTLHDKECFMAGYRVREEKTERCWTGCACRTPECEDHCAERLSEKEHDAQVAKAERERVLKPLIEWLTTKRKYYGACSNGSFANDDPEDCDPYDTVLRKVESIRAQQDHPSTKGGAR